MNNVYKSYLFNKRYLVGKTKNPQWVETYIALSNTFNICAKGSVELIDLNTIEFVDEQLGGCIVPEPFYSNFPKDVKKLTAFQLLFDQIVHYSNTYVDGNWDEPGHSIWEETDIKRALYDEDDEIQVYTVIDEERAVNLLRAAADDICLGTRPLNLSQVELLVTLFEDGLWQPTMIKSKSTAIDLYKVCKSDVFLNFLSLSDVPKLAENLDPRNNIKKLHLSNQSRKLIRNAIKVLAEETSLSDCLEKKQLWKGLLHHIHFKPQTTREKQLVNTIFDDTKRSVLSTIERYISNKDVVQAVKVAYSLKGSNYILRNLNRYVSLTDNVDEITEIISYATEDANALNLIQLQLAYANYDLSKKHRTFAFTKNNLLKVHTETTEEMEKRKSLLSQWKKDFISTILSDSVNAKLNSKLDKKVYIDEGMSKIALPLQETTAQSGVNVLAKGSKVDTNVKNNIRLFTYWEEVDDIDLSAIGMTEDLSEKIEFSWRTMSYQQTDAVRFSGDQTSGYFGGSEYIDINLDAFKKLYPRIKWVVVCNNVYSKVPFKNCVCRAGYMLRDNVSEGEVYEPKSVRTAFTVNCDSTFAVLFALNIDTGELVWLNTALHSNACIAAEVDISFIKKYFDITNCYNVSWLFNTIASNIVQEASEADIVVSDKETDMINPQVETIHSYDTEKQLRYLECYGGHM